MTILWKPVGPFYMFWILLLLLLLLLKISQQYKGGRQWEHLINPKTPTPHNQPMAEKKKKPKTKIKSNLGQEESIGSALKTRQSNTIKHRVTKIVPTRQPRHLNLQEVSCRLRFEREMTLIQAR